MRLPRRRIGEAALVLCLTIIAGLAVPRFASAQSTVPSASGSIAASEGGVFDASAAYGAIEALNQSAATVLAVITTTCAATTVSSNQTGRFTNECSSGLASLSSSRADLRAAAAVVADASAGRAAFNQTSYAALLTKSQADISQAGSTAAELSLFTYASRSRSFVGGPIAAQEASAGAAIAAQESSQASLQSTSSALLAFESAQETAIGDVLAKASAASSALGSFPASSLNSSILQEEELLSEIRSNLSLFYQQIPTSLPAPLLGGLLANITSTQSALSAYAASLAAVRALVPTFQQSTVGGLEAYQSSYLAAVSTADADGTAFVGNYGALQATLGLAVSRFPLLDVLLSWQNTLTVLAQQSAAYRATAEASFQAATSSLVSIVQAMQFVTAAAQGSATMMEVSPALLQSFASLYAGEGAFLNATGVTSFQQAFTSLQVLSQASSNLSAASLALVALRVELFPTAAALLSADSTSVTVRAQSTTRAMDSASSYLASDLAARSSESARAAHLVSQALYAFGALQVGQGGSLLSQASAELGLATSRSA